MSRRKVTMLEAFQTSARETAEREAAEQRRLIAMREKEARRALAAGASERGPDTIDTGRRPGVPPRGFEDVGGSPAGAAGSQGAAPRSGATERGPGTIDPTAPDARDGRTATVTIPPAPGRTLETVLAEEGAVLQGELLTLPLTARSFFVLQALLLASVFFIGWTVAGAGSDSVGGDTVTRQGNQSRAGGGLAIETLGSRPGTRPVTAAAQRGSAGRVAAPGAVTPAAVTPEIGAPADVDPAPAAVAAGDDYTAADRAFYDPAMRYTVIAVTSGSSGENVDQAWEAYYRLAAAGFAVVRPFDSGSRIFLFVGASASVEPLRATAERLQALRNGPNAAHEFRAARVASIEPFR